MNASFLLIVMLYIVILMIVLAIHSWKVYPIFFIIGSISFTTIGLFLINNSSNSWLIYALSIPIFILGYFIRLQSILKLSNNVESSYVDATNFNKEYKRVIKFSLVILLFIIYHFIFGGIPILNSNVEVERFNFNSSGFFGIPGRMNLYGIIFLMIYLSKFHKIYNNKKSRDFLIALWIIFILSRIFMGFKSGIVSVVSTYLIIQAIIGNPIRIKKLFSLKIILSLMIAVIFSIFITKMYTSLNYNSNKEIFNYLLQRMTVIQAKPADVIFSQRIFKDSNTLFILNDFKYFFHKYFLFPSSNVFPLDKIVSSIIYSTPLVQSNFIVPVTVTAFAGLYIDFGKISYIFMGFLGFLYSTILIKSIKAKKIFVSSTYGFAIIFFNEYITKGGLAYYLLNFVLMVAMLKVLEIFSDKFLRI